ncbi:hypothetical protein [Brevundimonas sp.]|jgi:hypothetical protein|uniref:hypothetical protein n=1 Tax=Brevundimonas sp. TaxID=1871086 RepID=UPI002E10EA7B|nr:hypothetical protein [Brevundimonas sp.]
MSRPKFPRPPKLQPDDAAELERLHALLWERVESVRAAFAARQREGWYISPRLPVAEEPDGGL